jgi:hypothetical protein
VVVVVKRFRAGAGHCGVAARETFEGVRPVPVLGIAGELGQLLRQGGAVVPPAPPGSLTGGSAGVPSGAVITPL